MVGIWGVGGSGKTTLASSLYMKISCRFQSHCIVDNIIEESRKHGLKTLQEKIISRISKKEVEVQSVDVGKHMIRSRSSRSNVLILLDDVNDIKQLDVLAGSHNWFGSGSRIIITTRDEHVLLTHKVDHVCPVTLLSHEEAIQLFNKHAYNQNNHVNNYDTLSSHVVSYAAGLPLALKVLGSFLYDKDEKEWMSSLARLKDIPDTEIMEKLKISYDGLKTVEKDLFLDIACFFRQTLFIGHAMEIFEACGYHPGIGMKVLRQKALITMDYDFLDMHDLIQELAYYIVKGDHPNNPETHSRFLENTMYLAGSTMENDKIEAMELYPCGYGDCASSRVYEIVSNMKKLRWLRVFQNFDDHAEGPSFLSNELRYISWERYPRSPFPDCFQPMKLVHLKLTHSLQNELWMGYKHLPHLKVLQLYNMKNLHRTPDFDGLPCLQKLELTNCDELTEIHPSLGNHKSLEQISVSKCGELRMIPTIVQMRKLKTLEIERCHKSLEFPEIKSYMESLVKLSLQGAGIDSLLSSIGERCGNLISLRLILCYHLKIVEVNFDGLIYLKDFALHKLEYVQIPICNSIPLRHWYGNQLSSWLQPSWRLCLQKLDLSNCNLTDGVIPYNICELSNLRDLNLSSNYFTRFHFSLSQLTQLKVLNLSWCESLVEFPKLPSRLAILRANGYWELEAVGDLKNKCTRLCQVSLMLRSSIKDGSRFLECMLQENDNHNMIMQLGGFEIAKGFISPILRKSRCRLQLPENWRNDFSGFLICAILSDDYTFCHVRMKQAVTSGMEYEDDVIWEESDSDEPYTVFWYIPFASFYRHVAWWNSIGNEVLFDFDKRNYDGGVDQSGYGVRLVPRKSGIGPTKTPTAQEESEFSDYAPEFDSCQESVDTLHVCLVESDCS